MKHATTRNIRNWLAESMKGETGDVLLLENALKHDGYNPGEIENHRGMFLVASRVFGAFVKCTELARELGENEGWSVKVERSNDGADIWNYVIFLLREKDGRSYSDFTCQISYGLSALPLDTAEKDSILRLPKVVASEPEALLSLEQVQDLVEGVNTLLKNIADKVDPRYLLERNNKLPSFMGSYVKEKAGVWKHASVCMSIGKYYQIEIEPQDRSVPKFEL